VPVDHRRRLRSRVTLAALSAGVFVFAAAGAASAQEEPDPVKDAKEQVDQVVNDLLKPRAPGASSESSSQRAAAPKATDDDSPGYDTQDPVPPDHASAEGLAASIAENELVSVGSSRAEIRDDHSSSADATALALGGQEVLGAHADSGGTEEQSAGDPLAPICAGSEGALCATLLYADAEAHEGATTSDSSASSGVASACIGGSPADADGNSCSGPVGAGVLQSWGTISRDGSGHTAAWSRSSVADVCIQPDPVLGTCTVGVEAVSSEGSSDSRGTATKKSQVVGLELGGQGGGLSTPTAIAIPPECTSPSLACVFLNQGETYLGNGIAGHAVQALDVSALDGTILVDAAQSETLVHKAGARNVDQPDDSDDGGEDGEPGPQASGPGETGPRDVTADDVLPDTGGIWSGLLAIGLLTVAGGGLLIARSRRRDLVDAAA
jgi:LPXTG-motif cell wall-anchored protein